MKNSTKLVVGGLLTLIGGILPIGASIAPLLIGGYLLGNVLFYLKKREAMDKIALVRALSGCPVPHEHK